MISLDEVANLAIGLPNVTEGTSYGNRAWRVGKALFAWERPLRASDLASFDQAGIEASDGPILGVRVDGADDKEAILQAAHPGLFTTPHFDGSPIVLIQLDAADPDQVEELVVDAWLCRASARAAKAYLETRDGGR